MQKYLKILSMVVVFSFLWGSWWGFYRKEIDGKQPDRESTVRVLTLQGVFPKSFVDSFFNKTKILLQVTEVDSEAKLLREALTHNHEYDLISMSSFIIKSFLIDNVFQIIDLKSIPNFKNISIDFKNLDYDLENKFVLPIGWGLNGFLTKTTYSKDRNENLASFLREDAKTSLIQSPVELFNLAIKLRPIVKTWVETGQTEELRKTLTEIKPLIGKLEKFSSKDLESGQIHNLQSTNGQAASLVASNKDYQFILPKEGATLWIQLIGLSLGTTQQSTAIKALNALFEEVNNFQLAESNLQASVLDASDGSKLPPLMQAQYIRNVPLSRVNLFINHEAIEPIWIQAIQSVWGFQ